MNREEIQEILSEKSFCNKCIYCKEEIRKGYYAEDNIGRRLIFPTFITKSYCDKEVEVPMHYKCVRPFLFDMLREGEEIDGTAANTKILIRY